MRLPIAWDSLQVPKHYDSLILKKGFSFFVDPATGAVKDESASRKYIGFQKL